MRTIITVIALLLSIAAGAQQRESSLKVEVPGSYGYTFQAPFHLKKVWVEVTEESFSYVYGDSVLASIPVCGEYIPNIWNYGNHKHDFLKALARPGRRITIMTYDMEADSIHSLWAFKGPRADKQGRKVTVRYHHELGLFIIEDEEHESGKDLAIPLTASIILVFIIMILLKTTEFMLSLKWLFIACFGTSWGLLLVFLMSLQPTLELVAYTGTVSLIFSSAVTFADWLLYRNQDKPDKKGHE